MDHSSAIQRRPHLTPSLIAAVLLVAALGKWPYDYYRVLRWVTCAASLFTAYCAYNWKQTWAVWVFGVVALVFNPLVPVHLTRSLWRVIDLGAACLFSAGAALLVAPEKPSCEQDQDVE